MSDPNGGIQPPIHLWWDLPTDDVGPWWVLPGVGAPVHVRRARPPDQSVAVQGTERFRLEQRVIEGSGLRSGDTVVWVQLDRDEQGGLLRADDVRARFGDRVADIVLGCRGRFGVRYLLRMSRAEASGCPGLHYGFAPAFGLHESIVSDGRGS